MSFLRAAVAIGLFAASFSASGQQAASIFTHVSLDGRWYATENRSPFLYIDGTGIFFPGARMQMCRRSDGQPLPFGVPAFYYGAFYYPVYQVAGFSMRPIPGQPGKRAVIVTTTPGNVICDWEVASPFPNLLFANGFDGSDVLFANGFERRP